MAKNLTKEKGLKVFKLIDKKDINQAIGLYIKFNSRKYLDRDWKKRIKKENFK